MNNVNNSGNVEHKYRYYDTQQKSEKSTNLDKDAFLNLLVTQLKNQDPLNPMEDKEFIAQMAQFSTLEQMQELNKNIMSSQEQTLEVLDKLNENQVMGSVQIIKELMNIRNAIEAYRGEPIETPGETSGDDSVE